MQLNWLQYSVISLAWVLALLGLAYLLKVRKRREIHWSTFAIHISLLIILLGAFLTQTMGRSGSLHLRLDDAPSARFVAPDGREDEMPFLLGLKDFRVENYPGTETPCDYVSYLTALEDHWQDEAKQGGKMALDVKPQVVLKQGVTRVGRPFYYKGWRFVPSAFDEDEQGCVLAVKHDPLGTGVTYLGYISLLISLLCYLLVPHKRHRHHHHKHLHHYVKSDGAAAHKSTSAKMAVVAPIAGAGVLDFVTLGNYSLPLAIVLLLLGMAFGVVYTVLRVRGKHTPHWLLWTMFGLLAAAWVFLTIMLAVRWHVSGHVPVSNGFEQLQTLAWLAMLAAMIVGYRNRAALPVGLLVSGLALALSTMPSLSPEMVLLSPTMRSPLLALHMVPLLCSFALVALAALISLLSVFLSLNEQRGMMHMVRRILKPAVCLLMIGLFVGAVWADVCQGTYWRWSMKEVWLLITLVVYAAALHRHSLPVFSRPRFFHIYVVSAFLLVLITCLWGGFLH